MDWSFYSGFEFEFIYTSLLDLFMNVDGKNESASLSYQTDWHIFDWYNGSLKSDEKCITQNLSVATANDALREQLAGVASGNKAKQLAIADEIKGSLASLNK